MAEALMSARMLRDVPIRRVAETDAPYTDKLTVAQGDGMGDIVGPYGHQHGDTAYLRLRTGGDPDNEDMTIGGDHTILIDGKHNITFSGFTTQNGSGQVRLTGGAEGEASSPLHARSKTSRIPFRRTPAARNRDPVLTAFRVARIINVPPKAPSF